MNPTRKTIKTPIGINQADEKDGMENVEGAASTPTTELFAGIFAERVEKILFNGAFSAGLGGCDPLFGDAFLKGSKLFTAFVAAVVTAFTAPVTRF
jgi:hypothetical protein